MTHFHVLLQCCLYLYHTAAHTATEPATALYPLIHCFVWVARLDDCLLPS